MKLHSNLVVEEEKHFSVGRSLDDDDENSLVCCAQEFVMVSNGCNKVLIMNI
jgi:hypothetical protein